MQDEITTTESPAVQAPAATLPSAAARLVEYAPGLHVALPPHTTYALLENPVIEKIPGTARHALGLVQWQASWLPLLDLHSLLHETAMPLAHARYVLVLAYEDHDRHALGFAAVAISALPETVIVNDAALCALPPRLPLLPRFALSCFLHDGEAVPILDTSRLFNA